MQIDLSRFRAAFYVEAEEHLQHMEAALLQLESAPRDTELLNTIFRAAHSIKGASTTFGIDEVGKFTHVLESLLERLRDGIVETSSELIELLLTSIDVIEGLVANAKDGAPLPENLEVVFKELQRVNNHEAAEFNQPDDKNAHLKVSATRRVKVSIRPSREFFCFGQDPLLLIRELSELGDTIKIEVDASALPPLDEINPEHCYLAWTMVLETDASTQTINDVFMFLDGGSHYSVEEVDSCNNDVSKSLSASDNAADETQTISQSISVAAVPQKFEESKATPNRSVPANVSSPKASASEFETVRVDRQRLDELINQIGELVIGASMVEQEVMSIAAGRGIESLSSLGKIVRDLQEMSLGLRMVPIAATFQKLNRVVRDVAKKVGKQINFVTEGDDTEIDKTVIDQISDPLVHMVRNAADHGVETPDERRAAGKPEEGLVKLRAYQQGGNIYIELQDDGRGLNRKRIVEKAIERQLIPADANLSDAEVCNLIFQPGFSTAQTVTDVSGRGVGMDVVRRNVEALQGSVSIKSIEGEGSTLTVRLPLTLAILDGLLVRLSEEVFVIPLLSVIESICLEPSDIKQIVGLGEVIMLRGEVIPMLRLHRLLNMPCDPNAVDQGLVVIVEDQGRRLALKVDELLGQQQVVIKNLETNFCKVPGVAGATILGDGRVALILDVYGVSNLANEQKSCAATICSSIDESAVVGEA